MTQKKAKVKRQRRPDERPDEIAAAALRLFCERGIRATSIDDIAAAAGVTKGAVYHHFKNKEHLLHEALGKIFDRMIFDVKKASQEAVETDLKQALRNVFDTGMELWLQTDFPSIFCLVFGEAGNMYPALRKSFIELGPFRGWREIASLVERGQASGVIRADIDSSIAARTMAGALVLQAILFRGISLSKKELRQLLQATIDQQLKLLFL